LKEIREQARKLLKGYCRLCRVCDGRACAGQVPGMGGVGTGRSFMNNVDALRKVQLNQRVIHDAVRPDTSLEFMGHTLSLPVMAAPIAGMGISFGGLMGEEDYLRAVLTGCIQAGTLGMSGDGGADVIRQAAWKMLAELKGAAIPILKPWHKDLLLGYLADARRAGAVMAGTDLDAVGFGVRVNSDWSMAPKTKEELTEIIAASGMPMIIKGIMSPHDAESAAQAGAAAIVVSNHGGRSLDHTPGTAEVLPAIARAVGDRVLILADGGVRTGEDVLKMLALGADAVLIGRPILWAAVGGGADGVAEYLEQLKAEFTAAMLLTGCRDLSQVGRKVIYSPNE
jgi:isopentenyl diphosphate isomerase/L-lactate dehydrogenase-like FMN-dependent dehydrogenase